ncbi:MAG: SUMF1/EgtB/PvdO family nonheme iron enzyme [Polyangiaceae bacterium]
MQQVEVVLHAACAGTMAYSAKPERGPQRGEAQSCVDLEKQRVLVEPSPTGPRGPDPALSRGDTFDLPCAAPPAPGRACIPGGATILGSSAVFLVPDLPPVPERLTVVPPFYIDLDEVTVGRYRQALADGFVAPTIVGTHQGPLGDTIGTTCTFSTSDLGREGYALNCVDWITAEAFCAFAGGRLPSEAEWEHAATLAGGDRRSIYPYGDEAPTCERAVHGRFPLANSPGVCEHLGRHPESIDAAPDDVTAQGLRGMAGGLSEWQRDAYAPYDDACWAASPIAAPSCDVASPARRSVRGGNWVAPSTLLPSASRTGADPAGHAPFIGFRCVYPAEPAP